MLQKTDTALASLYRDQKEPVLQDKFLEGVYQRTTPDKPCD